MAGEIKDKELVKKIRERFDSTIKTKPQIDEASLQKSLENLINYLNQVALVCDIYYLEVRNSAANIKKIWERKKPLMEDMDKEMDFDLFFGSELKENFDKFTAFSIKLIEGLRISLDIVEKSLERIKNVSPGS